MTKKPKKSAKPSPIEAPSGVNTEAAPERGMVKSRAKECAFCKHYYIKPCSDKTKDDCPNWMHLKSDVRALRNKSAKKGK